MIKIIKNALTHSNTYHLSRECSVAEQERWGLRAPGFEVVFGVLDENVCGIHVSSIISKHKHVCVRMYIETYQERLGSC